MAKRTPEQWLTVLDDHTKRRSLTYKELKDALVAAQAVQVSQKGSHRTFKHPDYPTLITLVDRGNAPLLIGYVQDVRTLVRTIVEGDHA